MKKSMIALLFAACLSVTAFAQKGGSTPDQAAQRLTEKMKTQLALTEVQLNAVTEINRTMFANLQEAGGRNADKAKKDKIREDYYATLSKVLDKEQAQKARKMKIEEMEQRKGKKAMGG